LSEWWAASSWVALGSPSTTCLAAGRTYARASVARCLGRRANLSTRWRPLANVRPQARGTAGQAKTRPRAAGLVRRCARSRRYKEHAGPAAQARDVFADRAPLTGSTADRNAAPHDAIGSRHRTESHAGQSHLCRLSPDLAGCARAARAGDRVREHRCGHTRPSPRHHTSGGDGVRAVRLADASDRRVRPVCRTRRVRGDLLQKLLDRGRARCGAECHATGRGPSACPGRCPRATMRRRRAVCADLRGGASSGSRCSRFRAPWPDYSARGRRRPAHIEEPGTRTHPASLSEPVGVDRLA